MRCDIIFVRLHNILVCCSLYTIFTPPSSYIYARIVGFSVLHATPPPLHAHPSTARIVCGSIYRVDVFRYIKVCLLPKTRALGATDRQTDMCLCEQSRIQIVLYTMLFSCFTE